MQSEWWKRQLYQILVRFDAVPYSRLCCPDTAGISYLSSSTAKQLHHPGGETLTHQTEPFILP